MLTIMMRLALAVGLLSSLLSSGRSAAAADQPKYYLSLGDSIAVGTGASTPAETYIHQLNAFFGAARSYTFGLTLAIYGESSASFITSGQLDLALDQINSPENDAAAVTLTIGGNDLTRLLQPGQPCNNPSSAGCPAAIQAALATFSTNYTTIMSQLQAALQADGGDTLLLVMTYYNPFSGTGSEYEAPMNAILLGTDGRIDCSATGAALGLNDRIACIGSQHGARIVDVYPLFVGRGLELTHIDVMDIHPNDAGYDVITSAFLRQIRSIFLPVIVR